MRKLYSVWTALTLSTMILQAQPLTRDEAVRIALKNNLGIELARNAVAIASINNSYGIAGGLPVVTGTISDQENSPSFRQVYSNAASNKASNNAFSNNLSGGVNGYMLLYNGQRVINAKRQLNTVEAQTRQVLSSRALILVNNVLLKYYDVVRQQSYAKTLQASIDAQKQQLAIVQAQQSVGLANNADLFQSQVDLNTQVQNLQAQQLVIDQDKTDLLTLMTLNPDSAIVIEDTILIDRDIQLPTILSAVRDANPDVIAANLQITVNQYIENQVSALRYPSLTVNGGYNYSRTNNSSASQYSPLFSLNYGPYVGVTLGIPIFNGNIYKKQQQVAGINIKNARAVRDTLVLGYTSAAVKSYQAYTSNLRQVATAQATYDLSRKLLDLVMQRFQLKQATIVDVKNAQQSFENAGFLLVNVSYAAKASEITLRRYANQLVN
ncbi:MAG TPA: TolC family protein [Puia sp.]|nr:TolC family protein [Puia sp.]